MNHTPTSWIAKRDPLLSDTDLGYVKDMHTPEQVRDIYEAARVKDAELIQRLVDALNVACNYAVCYEDAEFVKGADALSAAEAAGFKPSDL
jgi:hypothetical protein